VSRYITSVLSHERRWVLAPAPLEVLRPHEETDPSRLEDLRRRILRDGVLKKPVLVDSKPLVILDGHHRVAFSG